MPAQLEITAAGGVKGLVKALLDPGCHEKIKGAAAVALQACMQDGGAAVQVRSGACICMQDGGLALQVHACMMGVRY